MNIDLRFDKEMQWQLLCLVTRLAKAHPQGIATIKDCKRIAEELLTKIEQEYGV